MLDVQAKVDVSYEEREREGGGSQVSFKRPLYIPPYRSTEEYSTSSVLPFVSTTQRSSIEDDSIGEIPANACIVAEANNSAPRCSIFGGRWPANEDC